MAPRTKKTEIKEETPVEKTAPKYPHVDEVFNMIFSTDTPGVYTGIRRGFQLGSIEFYPVQAPE